MISEPSLIAVPMHGQQKLSHEGYRTRDGHLIEWFGRLLADKAPVRVVSRPEPLWIPRKRIAPESVAPHTLPVETQTLRMPNPLDRRRWWVSSANAYPIAPFENAAPIVTWNPFFAGTAASMAGASDRRLVVDLLDDWTLHFAFATIRRELEDAYRRTFDRADSVFANAEGTAELARRFGRDDVVLLPNGTDPERFSAASRAQGPLTVGYVGKIGKRVDLDLVLATARSFPDWRFVFAGPILDREYVRPLTDCPNIELLGDVHYDRVPALLETYDIGWVPHRVGVGEVGGDVIKTYEYRAAGLPVLTTPVSGASARGLDDIHVIEAGDHAGWLASFIGNQPRARRTPASFPADATWQHKAKILLNSAFQ